MDGAMIKPDDTVPVTKHLAYLVSYKKYLKDLHSKMRELNFARIDVKQHLNRNRRSNLEVPAQVVDWLEEVDKINAQVDNVPIDAGSSLNLMNRHKLGKKAFKIIEEIESLLRQQSLMAWSDVPVPLGKVDFMKASASSDHNEFQSREQIFMDALKALGPNNTSHMIALSGMGGVGKTTMVQRLKKVVKDKKMFHYIVEVVVGANTDPIAIQDTVADYLSIELKGNTRDARAYKLRECFKALSGGGKMKFLVILDDVWSPVDLDDIGLSSLPNQGVDFKVLLTSRNSDICMMMGASLIFNLNMLTDEEAHNFFRRYAEISYDADPELIKIGEAIVEKCGGLPIAIKTMAVTLRNKRKDAWKDALSRLEHRDTHNVVADVLKLSYSNIQDEETRSIFLLCGLFPEDFDIPTEDLVRYGWGLKIFTRVYTMRHARKRLDTCIERLMHANMLIKSDNVGFVKMHDLVRAFVLGMLSEVEHASIVNHGDMPGWFETANDKNSLCKRISLTCKGMSAIPEDLTFPNLSILKLMDGDESLRFPEGFYGEMENLQVISYDNMKQPFLPQSLQCSNVRVLHLHHCSLMFDCSSIGNLLNLEVLSIANSAIKLLPSTIGDLKKLRLLDLTNCVGLCIANGVFRNLVKLEELYMRVDDRDSFFVKADDSKTISFMDDNYNEMEERLENISVLEFEFFQNSAQPKNISFDNLEQFKISVGRSLKGAFRKSKQSFENTLQLVTNKRELLGSRMNELFEKTEMLCLSVDDMNDLGDIEVKSVHPSRFSSFYNVRVLVISECVGLRYLFTLAVAKDLKNLEHLEVYSCDNMEELIHSENGGEETITFPKLKFLSLICLPNLLGLCCNANIIELPQLLELGLATIPNFTSIYPKNELATSCLLRESVVIPKLEKLHIRHMENLKEIWPCELSTNENFNESLLKAIEVTDCDKLVDLFPCNPLPLLDNLQELQVRRCGSIEVLFNINLDSAGGIGEGSSKSSLRSIEVNQLGKLRELWRIKGANSSGLLIGGFQAVEYIEITKCKSFRNVFTPTTTNFDLRALKEIWINNNGENRCNNNLMESSQQEQEIIVISNEDTSKVGDCIPNVVFPSYLVHSFPNLHQLKLWNFNEVEVVFEIEPRSRELVTTHDNQQQLLPYLKELDIRHMDNMNHVWKCNWNKFLILQEQKSKPSFHNLTTIHISSCTNIKYLFSPLMAKLLSNLKNVNIAICDAIEEVVSNRDDEDEEDTRSIHKSTAFFPYLDFLTLACLSNLKYIGGGGAKHRSNESSSNNTTTRTVISDESKVDGVSWSLCQYPRVISIVECDSLSTVIPSYALRHMQKLEALKIESCKSVKEVFEGNSGTQRLSNVIMLQLPKLKKLEIKDCDLVEHIFTFSALGSLIQLEELMIEDCKEMEVIIKEEHGEKTTASNVVVFPRLKSIKLVNLPYLQGFFLGMNEFKWPSLDNVAIRDCPEMTVFTRGRSMAPQLKSIQRSLGKDIDECDLNFHQTPLRSLGNTLEVIPLPVHDENRIHLENDVSTKKIIPWSALQKLQMLKEIHVWSCNVVEEVFEALEGTNSGSGESQTVVNLPNLTKVELVFLKNLRYIWKSNQWTIFEFPNLKRVSISHCHLLEHLFTSSMIGSLLQLQELHISCCNNMQVVVKDENVVEKEEKSLRKMNEIMLPHLKSLILDELPSLRGFCLGKKDFCLPLLDTLRIERCGAITDFRFIKGYSATLELKETESSLGS
ncbi:uncharacterized protein LOC111909128 [Lactuca sativa]|uniref:uncharacterized protein LOC111909128 n=1 Tax=Lactuca sativa TaxID=4236 RepID=UPI000CD8EF92|nr:uncharacterized protein LOC111909128 [Lactuca sativa]XP_052624296.1 uncharacterized protein LOC111909128 [Lactuca sativa]XP_052624297.1 uncharacterized protein LOC111909128 [Lactuca sativa]XP_052624298.1 uncharacterized protein LOC111909128 [Lactuca sativa]